LFGKDRPQTECNELCQNGVYKRPVTEKNSGCQLKFLRFASLVETGPGRTWWPRADPSPWIKFVLSRFEIERQLFILYSVGPGFCWRNSAHHFSNLRGQKPFVFCKTTPPRKLAPTRQGPLVPSNGFKEGIKPQRSKALAAARKKRKNAEKSSFVGRCLPNMPALHRDHHNRRVQPGRSFWGQEGDNAPSSKKTHTRGGVPPAPQAWAHESHFILGDRRSEPSRKRCPDGGFHMNQG